MVMGYSTGNYNYKRLAWWKTSMVMGYRKLQLQQTSLVEVIDGDGVQVTTTDTSLVEDIDGDGVQVITTTTD